MNPPLYVDVALPLAVEKTFTYSIPDEIGATLMAGMRVRVPVGKRSVIGFAITILTELPDHLLPAGADRARRPITIKPIEEVLDPGPVISAELLHLTKWMAEYYMAPWGEVLKAVLVQGATKSAKRFVMLSSPDVENIWDQLAKKPKQQQIVRELIKRRKASVTQLQKIIGGNIATQLSELERLGFIRLLDGSAGAKLTAKFENVIQVTQADRDGWHDWLQRNARDRRRTRQVSIIHQLIASEGASIAVSDLLQRTRVPLSVVKALERQGALKLSKRQMVRAPEYDLYPASLGKQGIVLNRHQAAVLASINAYLDRGVFKTILLHGVTGSGKTQVYIEAIRHALALGKDAIVLVPEISLTSQIIRRFKFHFGNDVVALHSRMTKGERIDSWRLAHEGKCRIIIGPRSAVFAPLRNLGIIVVDEEHESSYKQFEPTPRYHARDVAIMRAHQVKCPVVLGSATSSLESYSNAVSGKYALLELPERVDGAVLPRIDVVDMTVERRRKLEEFYKLKEAGGPLAPGTKEEKFESTSISDVLKEKIADRLNKHEGIILLQNRRGFAPFVECLMCGFSEMCDNCNISLTYHSTKGHLRCHYCGLVKEPPAQCPSCGSDDIEYKGFGTQRVEDDVKAMFPDARIIRMDMDTTTESGAHDQLLKRFSEGKADILLGTQMVAKGLDFPHVTLVGVISADTQMLLPDFRASERTFQLLTQVAGRSGRSTKPGEVVIQTRQPNHPSLRFVLNHDYPSFYKEEMKERCELDYPPYSRIVLVEFHGKAEEEVMKQARSFAALLDRKSMYWKVLGPAPAALPRLRGKYRWHLVVKALRRPDPSGNKVHALLREAIEKHRAKTRGKKNVELFVDIDPAGMM